MPTSFVNSPYGQGGQQQPTLQIYPTSYSPSGWLFTMDLNKLLPITVGASVTLFLHKYHELPGWLGYSVTLHIHSRFVIFWHSKSSYILRFLSQCYGNILTYFIIQSNAIWLLGLVSIFLSFEFHFWVIIGVWTHSEHAPLLIQRKFVKAHWTYKTEKKEKLLVVSLEQLYVHKD